ncbi:MAG: RNA-binding protein [Nitrososphaerota archaeon]|nr:RNA-binding protein [Nitrososphaerota archaeon]MDG6939559.1 RNA-binding protein [Nitrososphaerota archaeon]
MSKIQRKFVVPGDLVVKGDFEPVANAYRDADAVYALKVGLSEIEGDKVRIIPLAGRYIPRIDDPVVGIVTDVNAFAWTVEINSFFPAFITASDVFGKRFSPERDDLTRMFNMGDVVLARVAAFDRFKDPMLSVAGPRLGAIRGGQLVKVSPVKVPRLIGRRGAMTKMIEDSTGTRITIGQNGYTVITGPPDKMLVASQAIELVETDAHMAGLTETVQAFLTKSMGRNAVIPEPDYDGE